MASFLLKRHIFPTFLHSTENFTIFPLNCIPQILYADSIDKVLIITYVKSFPLKALTH